MGGRPPASHAACVPGIWGPGRSLCVRETRARSHGPLEQNGCELVKARRPPPRPPPSAPLTPPSLLSAGPGPALAFGVQRVPDGCGVTSKDPALHSETLAIWDVKSKAGVRRCTWGVQGGVLAPGAAGGCPMGRHVGQTQRRFLGGFDLHSPSDTGLIVDISEARSSHL